MPQFPSRTWMDAFCDGVREHPEVDEVAQTLDGVYRFVVTPAGPLETEHAYDVAIGPGATPGEPTIAQVVDSGSDPRVTLTASYLRWQQLITGRLDVAMAVMLRQLRVSGDLSPIRSGLSGTRPLLDALKGVDTQWMEDG